MLEGWSRVYNIVIEYSILWKNTELKTSYYRFVTKDTETINIIHFIIYYYICFVLYLVNFYYITVLSNIGVRSKIYVNNLISIEILDLR